MCNPIQWSSEIILEAIQLLLCCTRFLVKHIKCSSGEGEVSTSTAQMEFLTHLGEMEGIRRSKKFAYTLLVWGVCIQSASLGFRASYHRLHSSENLVLFCSSGKARIVGFSLDCCQECKEPFLWSYRYKLNISFSFWALWKRHKNIVYLEKNYYWSMIYGNSGII